MFYWPKFKIKEHERGLRFRDGVFQEVLQPGEYRFFDPLRKEKVEVVSTREAFLLHDELDVLVKSGALGAEVTVVDLKNDQRAIVWVDGRFDSILEPGLYALWTVFRDVRVEIVDASKVRFESEDLPVFMQSAHATSLLDVVMVEAGSEGLLFKDGEFVESLSPGTYAFWKGAGNVKVLHIDLRQSVLDVAGQEIMTADKVTLRLNAVVSYKVVDALKSILASESSRDAFYREAQLVLRAVVGTRDLDSLFSEKDAVAHELEESLAARAGEFGFEVFSFGIRDVVLPGDMKDLMNKVMEAKKEAEANFIARREETAAMRSQANTAKILESNPTLMRLRELEVLEKVAGNSKLQVVLGEKGLADRVVNLL